MEAQYSSETVLHIYHATCLYVPGDLNRVPAAIRTSNPIRVISTSQVEHFVH
jgi:hypothetical protein